MGYDNKYSGAVVVDLETAPLSDAADYIESVAAPSNYKDPVKIAAYAKEKQAETVDRASLDPDLCRIVCLGYQFEHMEVVHVIPAENELHEQNALTLFWREVASKRLIGFNILGFDALVLLRRSLYLNVKAPRLQVDRFKHPQIIDLMDELSFGRQERRHGLKLYAKRFGLKVVEDGISGAQIPSLVAAGEWGQVAAHCEADVRATGLLAARLGHFRGVSEPAGVL